MIELAYITQFKLIMDTWKSTCKTVGELLAEAPEKTSRSSMVSYHLVLTCFNMFKGTRQHKRFWR